MGTRIGAACLTFTAVPKPATISPDLTHECSRFIAAVHFCFNLSLLSVVTPCDCHSYWGSYADILKYNIRMNCVRM